LQNKNKIDVVADQTGAPTYAIDLAQFILNAILQKFDFKGTEIYHFTNAGITTWENFARAIKKKTNNTNCIIHPVASKDYPTKAQRPNYSVLSCEKTKKEFNLNTNTWQLALKDCLNNLKN
jgi:dTDP-4-dehydrorhamnose reductase